MEVHILVVEASGIKEGKQNPMIKCEVGSSIFTD